MAEIKVNFMHPTDGRIVTATMDESMTAQEAIGELIGNKFVPSNPQGYNLAPKGDGRPQLQPNETFVQAGVKDGDTLRVIPATDAGA
ncbi:MAG: hypothetical protein ABFD82_19020 [Syntrophaceae bacterium]